MTLADRDGEREVDEEEVVEVAVVMMVAAAAMALVVSEEADGDGDLETILRRRIPERSLLLHSLNRGTQVSGAVWREAPRLDTWPAVGDETTTDEPTTITAADGLAQATLGAPSLPILGHLPGHLPRSLPPPRHLTRLNTKAPGSARLAADR